MSAIKERENGNENVIRFYDVNGKNAQFELKLFDKAIKTEVLHNEVKTFTENGKELNLIED